VKSGPTTKAFFACGAIAGPLFVIALLVEGITRAHYDPLRHPVSSLSATPVGCRAPTSSSRVY
jgi:hypothetical protein